METAFLFGAFGDVVLQGLYSMDHPYFGSDPWGLEEYFKQHGRMESVLIAGGLTSGFHWSANKLLSPTLWPLGPLTYAAYGAVVDVLFRTFMPMPSLKNYYQKLPWWMSIFWAAFPAYVLGFIV